LKKKKKLYNSTLQLFSQNKDVSMGIRISRLTASHACFQQASASLYCLIAMSAPLYLASWPQKSFIFLLAIFFFGFEETLFSWKVYFVSSGEGVKPRLFQALTRSARPDSNSKPAMQISNSLPSHYALRGQIFFKWTNPFIFCWQPFTPNPHSRLHRS